MSQPYICLISRQGTQGDTTASLISVWSCCAWQRADGGKQWLRDAAVLERVFKVLVDNLALALLEHTW